MDQEFRRKAPRRHFQGQIGVLYNGHMTITTCSQLGEGGALIHSDDLLNIAKETDEFVVTLFLPNIGGVISNAICVYRSGSNKIGLQFNGLEMKYKVRVREFVSRRKAIEVD